MQKTDIDWADMSWNPVTGCKHNCEYCYARGISNRFRLLKSSADVEAHTEFFENIIGLEDGKDYTLENGCIALNTPIEFGEQKQAYPTRFEIPTFHRYRLDEPSRKKKPQTIFVGSMCDLFGEWIPDEWISEVFKACKNAPQHRYLFLTKNPGRYADLKHNGILPSGDSYWFGATFDHSNWPNKAGHDPGDYYFPNIGQRNRFISFEPLTMNFNICSTGAVWHIIGAETGNRKGKITPEREWVENIIKYSRKSGAKVFMKESLRQLMGDNFIQEYPWEAKPCI